VSCPRPRYDRGPGVRLQWASEMPAWPCPEIAHLNCAGSPVDILSLPRPDGVETAPEHRSLIGTRAPRFESTGVMYNR
jgi:hypothetical protein